MQNAKTAPLQRARRALVLPARGARPVGGWKPPTASPTTMASLSSAARKLHGTNAAGHLGGSETMVLRFQAGRKPRRESRTQTSQGSSASRRSAWHSSASENRSGCALRPLLRLSRSSAPTTQPLRTRHRPQSRGTATASTVRLTAGSRIVATPQRRCLAGPCATTSRCVRLLRKLLANCGTPAIFRRSCRSRTRSLAQRQTILSTRSPSTNASPATSTSLPSST